MFWRIFLAITCVKVLLFPSYKSTDFEVHRNWLAITGSLPLSQWYTDSTSIWTLDYPPFFAYFEYALAQLAAKITMDEPEMLRVSKAGYNSAKTLLFQRISVVVSDVVLALGLKSCISKSDISTTVLILCNVGLLMVDHVHFQYNGFLFGFLFLSIGAALKGSPLLSGFWFAVLCNFKHIFAYCAPAYVVFLLRTFCFEKKEGFKITRFAVLASTVLAVCAVSFFPFAYYGQMDVVLRRLFPFKRGLTHAYWAPNFWALYNALDKILSRSSSSTTKGLVQEFRHDVLPSISPPVTFCITVISMIPALIRLWYKKHCGPQDFVISIVLCSWSSFLFGWHVHEKAILLVILPLTLLATALNKKYQRPHLIISIAGHVSLFPLLFQLPETSIKVLLTFTHSLYCYYCLQRRNLKWFEIGYLLGLIAIFVYDAVLHSWLLQDRFPFVPLMLYSLYCGVGVMYAWLLTYKTFLFETV